MKKAILLLLFLLSLSVCLNLFQWSNATVTCDNIPYNCLKLDNKSE